MNVLIALSNKPDINEYFKGIATCLVHIGHRVAMWDINSKPVFDMFDECKPDIFIYDDEGHHESTQKCIDEIPHLRTVCHTTTALKKRICSPNLIISTEKTDAFYLPKAANSLAYTKVEYNKMFECSILHIGTYNPLLDIVSKNNISCKFFGEKTRNEHSCGFIRQPLIGSAFYSADCILHIHEFPTSQQLFDIMYCGGSCFSTISDKENTILQDRISWFDNEDFSLKLKIIQDYEKDPDKVQDNQKFVKSEHTYFNRCIDLFEELNLDSSELREAKKNEK